MNSFINMNLFVVLPYVMVFTFLLVSIRRYVSRPFTYSTLSSQFLERKSHFWALVPFHYGLILVLAGHLLAFLIPRSILAWNSVPLRLYALEITGLGLAMLTLIGLLVGVTRRLKSPRLRVVTTPLDWVIFALLLSQVITGIGVAVMHPWGSSWFAAAMSPYLWSLVKFQPNLNYVSDLPWMIKTHIVNAYVLLLVFPFSRLAHVLVAPIPYLWRRPQVVRWYSADGAK